MLNLKRLFDLALSLPIITILIPLFFFIGILVKLDSKGPFFFISVRVGINGNKFKMIKFRTMYLDTKLIESNKIQLSNKITTRVGKILRNYSLDELPQFLNVLIGDMSIVGPRPSLLSQTDLNASRKKIGISSLKPGITGLAQISGRDLITTSQKLRYETEYLNNNNLLIDLIILIKTFKIVLTKKGILH